MTWLPNRHFGKQTKLRLLCFPHAGGGAARYYRWAGDLPRDVEVLPVKLPGREERFHETPFQCLSSLLEAFVDQVPWLPEVPLILFGHSMGALISFELGRLLRRRFGRLPSCLIVAASRAPQLPAKYDPIHQLPDEEFLSQVAGRYGRSHLAPADEREWMRAMLPTLRADITMVETYTYCDDAPLECPILALGGHQDRAVSVADLDAWRSQTNVVFTQRMFSGDHFFLDTARPAVLETIRRRLEPLTPT